MLTYRNKRLDLLYITKKQKDFTHHFDWFSLYFAKWTFIYKVKPATIPELAQFCYLHVVKDPSRGPLLCTLNLQI